MKAYILGDFTNIKIGDIALEDELFNIEPDSTIALLDINEYANAGEGFPEAAYYHKKLKEFGQIWLFCGSAIGTPSDEEWEYYNKYREKLVLNSNIVSNNLLVSRESDHVGDLLIHMSDAIKNIGMDAHRVRLVAGTKIINADNDFNRIDSLPVTAPKPKKHGFFSRKPYEVIDNASSSTEDLPVNLHTI